MKKMLLFLLFFISLILTVGCSKEPNYQLENGGFENELSNWNTTALNQLIYDDIFFYKTQKYMKEGAFFLSTKDCNDEFELTSSTFQLGGLGYVTFLLSGSGNTENTFVSVHSAETDEELETANNISYDGDIFTDNFTRIVWDLSSFIGTDLYIKITDNDETYLNVDAFDSFIETEEELEGYQTDILLRLGFQTEDLVMSAEYYINLYKQSIDPTTRYTYHVMGEMGWINDPNGFVYYDDAYHLFYQHNPYAPVWGPMHWGHVKSDDLIKWEYLPIAVAPLIFDAGGGAAFSGSAIDVDGDLYLMYTENWQGYQYQVVSKSTDGGITFDKINEGNAVIDDSLLPFYANPVDFRDPKIFMHEGIYYSVIGSRQINDFGQVLLFSSTNLVDWEYVGPVIQGSLNTYYSLGYMFECPDLFELNGEDVLIMSPQEIPGHRNTHGTVYVVGDMNYTTGMLENWVLEDIDEIDYGFDFYAPQTMIDEQGRRIMVAWMQSWNRAPMTGQFGWAGAMTIPRELSLDSNGKLIQYPVIELNNYRTNQQTLSQSLSGDYLTGFTGNTLDIELSFTPQEGQSGITVYADEEGNGTHIYYEDGYVYLNRTDNMGGRYPGDFYNITKAPVTLNNDGTIDLRILLDRYSIEVFVNHGERAITSTVYQSDNNSNIFLFSSNPTEFNMVKWELDVE